MNPSVLPAGQCKGDYANNVNIIMHNIIYFSQYFTEILLNNMPIIKDNMKYSWKNLVDIVNSLCIIILS